MATNRRIFVGNLPTDINEDDIRHEFSAYGNVTNVEIKQKKDNLNEGQANTFAFINMDIDTWSLNKCIQEFSEQEWKGKFLKVALAKESFLEQLQRERLEAKLLSKKLNKSIEKNDEIIEQPIQQLSKTLPVPVKQNKTTIVKEGQDSESSESSSSSSDSEPEQGKSEKPRNDKKTVDSVDDPVDDNSFIIKSNKHNSFLNPEKLKIPTYGPAIVSQNNVPHKKNLTPQSTLAEQKRIQSLQEKKEQYNKQKMLLQKSFLKIDVTPKNKIVFCDDNMENNNDVNGSVSRKSKKRKTALFDENENEDEENYQFDLKEQFEGKEGKKLLKLQSTFGYDKRFTMDSHFLEQDDTTELKNNHVPDTENLENEKKHQFEILENILGKRIDYNKDQINKDIKMKSMLRYDPSKPDHNKFLNKNEKNTKSNSKVISEIDDKAIDDNSTNDKEPLVSNQKFYSVSENLKEAIKENTGFSLLSMFGKADLEEEAVDLDKNAGSTFQKVQQKMDNPLDSRRNPFRYDTSDSEEETNGTLKSKKELINHDIGHISSTGVWRENFFFIKGDQRLSEGIKFFTTFSSNGGKDTFNDTRRELKKVVKYKILNNLRNAKPFKKKLGSHKIARKVVKN